MPICHPTERLISPKLRLRGSNANVRNGAILPYFTHEIEKIFVYASYHLRMTFATYYSVFAKIRSIRILDNFLANSKYLYWL